ncbi:MAG TPA: twin-arginine translocation signal domain-containing protein [Chitinophagaceae bacterium]|nr:twin-arginine translocation signal domain-containing protein [Chitinophagaceae bacterium]
MGNQIPSSTSRRGFIGSIAAGTAAFGISTLGASLPLKAEPVTPYKPDDPDAWFNKIAGKHRVVFDAPEPKGMFPFAWPKVFLMTNEKTGTATKDCSVVVVLRHEAIPYAMEDRLWEKYKFGEMFKITDSKTNAPSVRNPFWKPMPGDFKIPGVGEVQIGINQLQDDGVMFCVCDMAMTVMSAAAAQGMNMDPAEVKKDWVAGVLPGIPLMPSGVWAVGRAQEHGCAYVFAG